MAGCTERIQNVANRQVLMEYIIMNKMYKLHGKRLTGDEIGLHKKLVNRGARKFMCIDCLAAYYNVNKDWKKK